MELPRSLSYDLQQLDQLSASTSGITSVQGWMDQEEQGHNQWKAAAHRGNTHSNISSPNSGNASFTTEDLRIDDLLDISSIDFDDETGEDEQVASFNSLLNLSPPSSPRSSGSFGLSSSSSNLSGPAWGGDSSFRLDDHFDPGLQLYSPPIELNFGSSNVHGHRRNSDATDTEVRSPLLRSFSSMDRASPNIRTHNQSPTHTRSRSASVAVESLRTSPSPSTYTTRSPSPNALMTPKRSQSPSGSMIRTPASSHSPKKYVVASPRSTLPPPRASALERPKSAMSHISKPAAAASLRQRSVTPQPSAFNASSPSSNIKPPTSSLKAPSASMKSSIRSGSSVISPSSRITPPKSSIPAPKSSIAPPKSSVQPPKSFAHAPGNFKSQKN